MRCVIAKMNLVLMELAIKHYLDKTTQGTQFTFKSLYDDNEPYPLPELLTMVQEQIGLLEREFKERSDEMRVNALSVWRKKLDKLTKVNEQQQKKD
ncbi:hypothetical protein ACWIYZ_07745 [Ursidibacter arcticus]